MHGSCGARRARRRDVQEQGAREGTQDRGRRARAPLVGVQSLMWAVFGLVVGLCAGEWVTGREWCSGRVEGPEALPPVAAHVEFNRGLYSRCLVPIYLVTTHSPSLDYIGWYCVCVCVCVRARARGRAGERRW